MAGGYPISEAVARQAARWLTLLMSGEATDEDCRRWKQWRLAHVDHERAWLHIEAVTGRLKDLQPKAAYQALSPYTKPDAGPDALEGRGRRVALRTLLWAGGAGTLGLMASRSQTWQQVAADHRTGTAEQRRVTLEDGTVVTLNTASAINVRFDGQQRQVRLVAGEVLIVTGHAAGRPTGNTADLTADLTAGGHADDPRPFVVETAEGRIRALGTRFAVRQRPGVTQVSVLESAVEITPRNAAGQAQVLRAGERTRFTLDAIGAPQAAGTQATGWLNGQLVADDMRLGDFIAELGRYRPGIVRCVPAVADLRFSGVFPLQDTDRILSTLPQVLPVRVTLVTRYWVTVDAAP